MVFHYALKNAEDPFAVPEYSAAGAGRYSADYSAVL